MINYNFGLNLRKRLASWGNLLTANNDTSNEAVDSVEGGLGGQRISRREAHRRIFKSLFIGGLGASALSKNVYGQENINKSKSYEELFKDAENLFKNYKSLNLKEDQRKEKFDECFDLCDLAIKEAQKDTSEIERGLKLVEVYKLESRIYSETESMDQELKSITNAIDLCENIVSKYFANFAKKIEENSNEEKYLKNLSRLYISRRFIYRDQGEYNLAIKDISRGIELDIIKSKEPKDMAKRYELRADYNFYAGNYANTAFDLYKVLELDPSNKSAKEKLNKIKNAIAFKYGLYGLTAAGVGAILLIAKKMFKKGKEIEAITQGNSSSQDVLEKIITPEEMNILMGKAAERYSENGITKEEFREIFLRFGVGKIFESSLASINQGNFEMARYGARTIKELLPDFAEGYLLEAMILGDEMKSKQAAKELEQGLKLTSDQPLYYTNGVISKIFYDLNTKLVDLLEEGAFGYTEVDSSSDLILDLSKNIKQTLSETIDNKEKAETIFCIFKLYQDLNGDQLMISPMIDLCSTSVNQFIVERFGQGFFDGLVGKPSLSEERKQELRQKIQFAKLFRGISIAANEKTLEEKLKETVAFAKAYESKENLYDGDKAKLASLYQKILSLYEDIKKEKLKEPIEKEDFEKAETIKGEYDAKITVYKEKLEPLKELLGGDLKIDFDQRLGEDV